MHTDELDTKHRKKRPTKKPFVIEYRCTGLDLYREWRTHSKYLTEKQRQQALVNLSSKTMYGHQIFEYRVKP